MKTVKEELKKQELKQQEAIRQLNERGMVKNFEMQGFQLRLGIIDAAMRLGAPLQTGGGDWPGRSGLQKWAGDELRALMEDVKGTSGASKPAAPTLVGLPQQGTPSQDAAQSLWTHLSEVIGNPQVHHVEAAPQGIFVYLHPDQDPESGAMGMDRYRLPETWLGHKVIPMYPRAPRPSSIGVPEHSVGPLSEVGELPDEPGGRYVHSQELEQVHHDATLTAKRAEKGLTKLQEMLKENPAVHELSLDWLGKTPLYVIEVLPSASSHHILALPTTWEGFPVRVAMPGDPQSPPEGDELRSS